MSRGRWLLLAVAVAGLAMIAVALLAGSEGSPQGSVVSRGAGGWLAARRYLAARGASVAVWSRPLEQLEEPGVLVLTFPWQHGTTMSAATQVELLAERGRHVVVAYSGLSGNLGERLVLDALNVLPRQVRRPSLNPLKFRRESRLEWSLKTGAADRPVVLWAPRALPSVPKDAQVLLSSPQGDAVVASFEFGRGRVWLLPVDALSNARLGHRGNADLLETLRTRLGERWIFDEYHHGLVAQASAEEVAFGRVRDLLLVHLVVLYAAALLALARRFGPAWREPPVVAGSVASFLLGLGRRHDRLGHHGEAARLLLERVAELSPDLAVPDELAARAAAAGRRDLVPLASGVARLRRGEPLPDMENRSR